MAVSHCPIDLHSVSLMAPVIAIIHLTVKSKKKKKKGKKGEIAHTISLSLPCVQQTRHPNVSRADTWTTGPLHCVCARACMINSENMCGCASLVVCACTILHDQSLECTWGGEAVDMSDLAADQKHQRLVPLWSCERALISTRLCSVDRKNKRRETDRQRRRRRGT